MMNSLKLGLSAALVGSAIVIMQPQPAIALSPDQVNQIAQAITVLIDSKYPGSGVIVAHQGNTYYVLTAKHVVNDSQDKYEVVTADGKRHSAQPSAMKLATDVDLALVAFTSNQNYRVATVADYDLLASSRFVFVSGWVREGDRAPERRFVAGAMDPQRVNPLFIEVSASEGYELFYTNLTQVGMSGGPVLDVGGRLIGIHGRAEGERILEQSAEGGRIPRRNQLGFSLGIPVNTFKSWLNGQPEMQLNLQSDRTLPPVVAEIPIAFSRCVGTSSAVEWANCGNQLWRLTKYREAIEAYDQAIKINPKFYQAWFGRGNVLGYMQRYAEALESYDRALAMQPNFSDAWRFRGVVLYRSQQYNKALESFDRSIETADPSEQRQPRDYLDWYWRGKVLSAMQRYPEAIASYQRSTRSKPDFPGSWSEQGYVLTQLQRYEEALAAYEQAVKLGPDFAEAWNNRCFVLNQLQRYEEAIASCKKSLALRPKNYKALNNQGEALRGLKRLAEAIVAYKAAIDYKSDFYEAWRNWADALTDSLRYGEAVPTYDQALALRPNDAEAWRNRGKALYQLNRYEEATRSINRAIDLNPNDYLAWYYRGELQSDRQLFAEALTAYDTALKIVETDPSKPYSDVHIVWNNRGVALIKLKRYEEAVQSLDRALQIKPDFQSAIQLREKVVKQLSQNQK